MKKPFPIELILAAALLLSGCPGSTPSNPSNPSDNTGGGANRSEVQELFFKAADSHDLKEMTALVKKGASLTALKNGKSILLIDLEKGHSDIYDFVKSQHPEALKELTKNPDILVAPAAKSGLRFVVLDLVNSHGASKKVALESAAAGCKVGLYDDLLNTLTSQAELPKSASSNAGAGCVSEISLKISAREKVFSEGEEQRRKDEEQRAEQLRKQEEERKKREAEAGKDAEKNKVKGLYESFEKEKTPENFYNLKKYLTSLSPDAYRDAKIHEQKIEWMSNAGAAKDFVTLAKLAGLPRVGTEPLYGRPANKSISALCWALNEERIKGDVRLDQSLAVEKLAKNTDMSNPCGVEGDPLTTAVSNKFTTTVIEAIVAAYKEQGLSIDIYDKSGRNPLNAAFEKHRYSIARLLVQHGANINQGDPTGRTLLHKSAEHCSFRQVKELFTYPKVELSGIDDTGFNPLDAWFYQDECKGNEKEMARDAIVTHGGFLRFPISDCVEDVISFLKDGSLSQDQINKENALIDASKCEPEEKTKMKDELVKKRKP